MGQNIGSSHGTGFPGLPPGTRRSGKRSAAPTGRNRPFLGTFQTRHEENQGAASRTNVFP